MPVLGPLNPAQLASAGRRAVLNATQQLHPDHQAIARRSVRFAAPHMTLFYLYAAVAPSRWAARAFDEGQVERAVAFAREAFPGVFSEIPASADKSLTLFTVEDADKHRERALYVHPTGLVELLWALPVPDDPTREIWVDTSEMARVVMSLGTAVASDAYSAISRAGRGRRKFARVDWVFHLATGISGPNGPRRWNGLRFPDSEPPRAHQDWVAAPPDGYCYEQLLNSRRTKPAPDIAAVLLAELATANGYYAVTTAIAAAVRDAQDTPVPRSAASTDMRASTVIEDFDDDFQTMLNAGLEGAVAKLTPEQLAKVAEADDLEERLARAAAEATDAAAEKLVEELKCEAPGMLRHRDETRRAFEAKLAEHWGRAFDLTEMTIAAAFEIGEFFYNKHVPPDSVHDWTFEALGRLQARALRIAEEILVLLKAGFGQAGMARWRALHEVAVVADFILEHGDECAERYFDHEVVEAWKAMDEFQRHAEELGQEPYSEDEMNDAKGAYDAALARYGEGFRHDYGWAQTALASKDPRFEKGRIAVRDIEESVDAGHNRPYYRRASYAIHAQPRGVTWMPDSLPLEDGREVLLTGPSPAGLAEPGHAALISLASVTEAALVSKHGAATRYLAETLRLLVDEAGRAYAEAERKVDRDGPKP